ncbi:MAG: sugar phosphate nucleotidyltransferase [Thermacetogeniaceae bacterium]
MKAIIMAGGEGSRLRPLTCARPKPMVPIINRPCMEHIIKLLHDHQVREIGVTLQYLPEEIQNYFGDGRGFGVSLRYFIEDQPLGTAGSIKNCASFLDETFIVISGDAVTTCDLEAALEWHRSKVALATLVLTEVSCPLEYGVVITDQQGRIRRFLEKPGWGEVFSDQVNTGIYILEPEILDQIEPGRMVDFSKDLFPCLLAANKPVYAYVAKGYWCDIGTIEQYVQAHYDILEGKVEVAVAGTESQPGVWLGDGVTVDQTARLVPPVVVGTGSVIGPRAKIGPGVVLGQNVTVGRGASIKRSVVWDGALIGENAVLRGAVVGWRARVKAAASCFEGSVIGDRSVVGERCVIRPGVKIWPEKWVEKGARLSTSLIWGQSARPHFFGSKGIIGDLITEINPEIAARLGAAIGTVKRGRLSICTDGYPASQMIRHAVLSGLLATGVQVVDFGKLTLPAHRQGIRALRLNGGIHIYHRGLEKIAVRFFNNKGIDFSRNEQRQVEGMLDREEYRYTSSGQIVAAEYYPEVNRMYLNYLLGFLDRNVIRKARLRIAIDYDQEYLGCLLSPLFEALGCEAVAFPAARDQVRTSSEVAAAIEQFGNIVRERGADLGAAIDPGGEELVLIDDQGNVVQESRLMALLALITLNGNESATLALPVTMPEAVVEHARRRGCMVKRTKTAPWAQMQTALDDEVAGSQQRFPQFFFYGDALAALGMIVEHLAREGRPLSRLIESLPSFATAHREVEVTWDDKGKVLRKLAEDAGEAQAEIPEGIKLRHPEGWALVLPDADEPVCRVFAESFNYETAKSLTDMYAQKIREICGNGGEGQTAPDIAGQASDDHS